MTRRYAMGGICLLLVSCSSSRNPASVSRVPAQVAGVVPYVPGGNIPGTPYVPNAPAPGTPYVPNASASGPSHASGNFPNMPTVTPTPMPGTNPSDTPAQCSVRLDTVGVGNNQSILSLLLRSGNYGAYTQNWGNDRALAAAWFTSGPGTDIFESAKYSKPFNRAIQYVYGFGNYNGYVSVQDYLAGQRMSAVLISLLALARDPRTAKDMECFRLVRQMANGILGPYATELDEIPILKAAELARDPSQLRREFQQIDGNRKAFQAQAKAKDRDISDIERKNRTALKDLQRQLKLRYNDLRRELRNIPTCRRTVDFDYFTMDPQARERDSVQNMIDACQESIDQRLDQLKDDEARQMDIIADGGPNFPGSKIDRATQRLAVVQEKIRKLQEYEKLLTDDSGNTSVTALLKQLDEIVGKQSQTQGEGAQAIEAANQQKNLLLERSNQLAPRWLTYGYFGGSSKF